MVSGKQQSPVLCRGLLTHSLRINSRKSITIVHAARDLAIGKYYSVCEAEYDWRPGAPRVFPVGGWLCRPGLQQITSNQAQCG